MWCVDMSSSRSCASVYDMENVLIRDQFFHQKAFLIKRRSKFVFDPDFKPSPGTHGKKELEISGAQGEPESRRVSYKKNPECGSESFPHSP